jgi:LysR family transcriptional regulator, glycine cleavage system transcriptional activator
MAEKKAASLRAMQAFEAFGRLGSVTAAADELGVSVGAVSQQLHNVEAATHMRLLERRGRNIELTLWGKQFYNDISSGFNLLRIAQENLAQATADHSITISCLPSLAGKWLGSQLFDWQTRHPHATVRLIGEDKEPNLGEGQIDFRISYGKKVKNFERTVELFTDWAVPACSPKYLAKHPIKGPADILKLSLLGITWSRDQGASPSWTEWAASIGATYKKSDGEVSFSLSSAAIDAAINGKGFVLAQLSMAAEDIASGRLVVPFDRPIKLAEPYFLAWDRAALEKPYGAKLRTWLMSVAKRQRVLRVTTPQMVAGLNNLI